VERILSEKGGTMNVARTVLALLALTAVVMLAGCGADPAFTSGKVYLQQQDYENAIKQLKTAIRNSPDAWEPHMWLGRAYAETDELELASEEMFLALEMAPDETSTDEAENAIAFYAQRYRREGFNYIDAAQYEQAIAEYQKALIMDARHPDSHAGLGVAYQNMGDYDAAIAEFEAALELKPDEPILQKYLLDAYSVKAGSLDALEDYEGAIDYYERIKAVDPSYEYIDFNLGYMHYLLHEWPQAISYFETHLEQDEDDTDVIRMSYYAYYQIAEEVWDVDPETATTYYERAIAAIDQLVEIEDAVTYHRTLNKIYIKLGRLEEADAELEAMRMLLEAGSQ
jgi:tetratricopeptide (TPR) repeat protein